MDEHDDDLASEVDDGPELETDAYPDTAELNEESASDERDTDPVLDDDEAEI
jgi:hypothetical protein